MPGLAAKPIIDIALEVIRLRRRAGVRPRSRAAGYVLRIREPDWFEHRLLRPPDGAAHLHVFSASCAETDRMVRFRDWLRANDADRELYLATAHLAARDWKYMQQYADAKSDVVNQICARHG